MQLIIVVLVAIVATASAFAPRSLARPSRVLVRTADDPSEAGPSVSNPVVSTVDPLMVSGV